MRPVPQPSSAGVEAAVPAVVRAEVVAASATAFPIPVPGDAAPATPASESAQSKGLAKRILRDVVETAIFTLAIFFLVRSTVQTYRIDGDSMEPNFEPSQLLLVNKLAFLFSEPTYGDVIVFSHPDGSGADIIKRVVGVPGDTIEIRQGDLYINNLPTAEPYATWPANYDSPPVRVGTGDLYVLGDNRADSADSHAWGSLSQALVIGKAWLSLWPLETAALVTHRPVTIAVPGTS